MTGDTPPEPSLQLPADSPRSRPDARQWKSCPKAPLDWKFALATAWALLLPVVVTIGLVAWLAHAPITHFVPYTFNDEVAYWHKTLSYVHAGFDAGFYTIRDETVPASRFGIFGVNGPYFTIIYGTLAKIIGWNEWTVIPANLIVLGAGMLTFILMVRPSPRRILIAPVLMLLVWPVTFFIVSVMQESMQQAVALVLAGFFTRALDTGAATSRLEKSLGLTTVLLATIIRSSWGLLVIPMLLLYQRKHGVWRTLLTIAIGMLPSLVSLRLVSMFQAPGANSMVDRLSAVDASPLDGVTALLSAATKNAIAFGKGTSIIEGGGPQNLLIVGILIFCAFVLLARSRRARIIAFDLSGGMDRREAAFHLFNLGSVVISGWFLYLAGPGYWRVFAAHLLLSGFIMLARGHLVPVVVIMCASALMFGQFRTHFVTYRVPNFGLDRTAIKTERATIAAHARFERHAPSRWCNTMQIPLETYDWRATLVPPGIGIAAIIRPLRAPSRSRWVLLMGDTRAPDPTLHRVVKTKHATLYVNTQSDFPDQHGN